MFLPMSLLLVAVMVCITCSQLALKKGVAAIGQMTFSVSGIFSLFLKVIQNIWMLLAFACFAVGFVAYYLVLSKVQLNVAYPIVVSGGIILTVLTSWLIFSEKLSFIQIIGVLVIIIGIVLVLGQAIKT